MNRAVNWLRLACILTIATGLVAALGTHPATEGLWRGLLDLLNWPLDGHPASLDPTTRQVDAVLGGVMVGWGATLLGLTFGPLQQAPRETSQLMLVGLVAWFVVDSIGSVAADFATNLLLNVTFFGMFLVPLVVIGRQASRYGISPSQ